ncbi:ankyrin repeat domain-containing protein [Paenibacillus sp. H1-7]|uniref:ankyrin repeat domain-containing protein n=1 Tax=Paenibacillus sp. H1-7 TaxID=2282849 RepID=UPI001EF97022|nr:ankyrin repeat domain-containing protein [Paenibacillus sp. H1-7]ULL15852.1 ankyrin repeat domain-containing protein [Paenibacillus sp. H1-7]
MWIPITLLSIAITLTGCSIDATQPVQTGKESVQPMETEMNKNAQLIEAAEKGDNAAVERLLASGADINATDGRGRTAAMAATHGNKPETLRLLIAKGADLNIRDQRSDNPLLYAGAEGLLDIVKIAVEAKADTKLTNRYGGVAIIPASERGHVEVVKELLEHSDINVNHINNLGWTALIEAIVLSNGGEKHQQIVRLLIEHGADINIPDKDGITPLQHARSRGYKEIEAMLVQAGAK